MITLYNTLAVAAGGAIGAVCRYLITLLAAQTTWHPSIGTLIVNVIGSFLIGWWIACSQGRTTLFLTVGVCGGFTTFSTFSSQTLTLLQSGCYGQAGLYAAGSVVLCVAATWLGAALGNSLRG